MLITKIYKESTPTQIILTGFLAIICVGTFLLTLPISNKSGEITPFLTAFFTATSAVCVTGLVVENTLAYWSEFGKIVILTLIQIGGLGFMAIVTMIYMLFRKKVTLRSRLIISESLNQPTFHGMVSLVRKAIIGTLVIEGICAVILAIIFYSTQDITVFKSLSLGVFHSISAFCNAGFDIIGENSITPYSTNYLFNFVIMFLIISGGIGFAIWIDIVKLFKYKFVNSKPSPRQRLNKLSLHSRIAIASTLFLILLGGLLFFLLEHNNVATIGYMSLPEKFLTSFFHSVSLRTAGFNTIPMSELTDASKFISTLFMLIGGSPGGTAGGLKTVTLAVVIFTAFSVIRGNDETVIFNRSIPTKIYRKALAVTIIYIMIFFIATILLLVVESNSGFSYLDVSFEVASAVGTVGLSTGITSELSYFGKIIIIICMYLGRLGPISVGVALTTKLSETNNSLQYPEENILVG